MKKYEDMNLEFKEIYVPECKKDVLAFVNTEGGTLFIGIRKDGNIIGVKNSGEVMPQVASELRDSIRPDIMPFVRIHAEEREGKSIVEVNIQIGTNRPYYLQEKGLRPSGVYVRKGSASQPLSDEGIRELIIQTSGRIYEKERSLEQKLTFEYFGQEMKAHSLEFSSSQMKTL